MARNYYYLVSSLIEYAPGTEAKGLNVPGLRDEIAEGLSGKDRGYLQDLCAFYDVQNIVNLLEKRSRQFSHLGNFPLIVIEALAEAQHSDKKYSETDEERLQEFPDYIRKVLYAFKYQATEDGDDVSVDLEKSVEYNLWSAFYQARQHSGCKFLREWFTFDRNLRNITAAYTARSLKKPVAPELIGDGIIVEALARSNAADFGLHNEVPYIESVVQLLELPDMLEKEKKLDALRWNMAEELTESDYFNIDRILGYMVQVNLIHRWMALDKKAGTGMFRILQERLTRNDVLEDYM